MEHVFIFTVLDVKDVQGDFEAVLDCRHEKGLYENFAALFSRASEGGLYDTSYSFEAKYKNSDAINGDAMMDNFGAMLCGMFPTPPKFGDTVSITLDPEKTCEEESWMADDWPAKFHEFLSLSSPHPEFEVQAKWIDGLTRKKAMDEAAKLMEKIPGQRDISSYGTL